MKDATVGAKILEDKGIVKQYGMDRGDEWSIQDVTSRYASLFPDEPGYVTVARLGDNRHVEVSNSQDIYVLVPFGVSEVLCMSQETWDSNKAKVKVVDSPAIHGGDAKTTEHGIRISADDLGEMIESIRGGFSKIDDVVLSSLDVETRPGMYSGDEWPIEEVQQRYSDVLPPRDGRTTVAIDGMNRHYEVDNFGAIALLISRNIDSVLSMPTELWQRYKGEVKTEEVPLE